MEEEKTGKIEGNDSEEVIKIEWGEPAKKEEIHLEKKQKRKLTFKEKAVSFLKNKYNLAFLGVLFLALLIRLKYIGQESIWNDAAVHLWFAIKVTKEPLFFFSQSYLMGDYAIPQTIMAFFYLFTKNILLAGQIVAMLYGLAGIVFMYLLGTELRSRFTGLMAAAILSFNHIFWFYGVRPLADSPLLVTTIILLYCMVKLEKEKTTKWGILTGSMFLVVMLTKTQSALFVFALLICYLLFKRKEMITDKAIFLSWIMPLGFVLTAHILARLLFKASVLDRIFGLFLATRGMPFGFEAAGMLKWIFSWYLIPFVILGALFVIFYKKKEYYFSLVLFLSYWLFFEVCVDNTQDRYMLPLFSVAVLLASFAIEEISVFVSAFIHKYVKYVMAITIVLLICWNYYGIGDPLIYNKSFSYIGYEETGQWIKDNVPEDVPIFAGEYRSIRLFTEREFGGPPGEEEGGTIWNLRSPYRYTENYDNVSQSNFEEDVSTLSKKSDVYLEVDVWEYYQPKWYWPLTQESFNYFESLGFKLVKMVEREVLTKEGLQKMPVIFIFKKNKEA